MEEALLNIPYNSTNLLRKFIDEDIPSDGGGCGGGPTEHTGDCRHEAPA